VQQWVGGTQLVNDVQSIRPHVSLNTLKMIYYSCFHSVMTYGLLFWGHSSDSIKIFRLQKKIIRIMIGCRSSVSCRKLFFNLKILPPPSQYILCLLFFVIIIGINSETYHIDTKQNSNFHQPSMNLTKYMKGVYCLGFKVFNMLSSYITIVPGYTSICFRWLYTLIMVRGVFVQNASSLHVNCKKSVTMQHPHPDYTL
jgi:hypothetical protein